jgi:hypothetical protein
MPRGSRSVNSGITVRKCWIAAAADRRGVCKHCSVLLSWSDFGSIRILLRADRIAVAIKWLVESGIEIDSLNSLVTFAKARWPGHYSKDWRKSTANMQFGQESMQVLWMRYLEQIEARE